MFEDRLIPGVQPKDVHKVAFVVVRNKQLMLDQVYSFRRWVGGLKHIEKDWFFPEFGDDRIHFEERIREDDERNLSVKIEVIDGNLTAFVSTDSVWDSELERRRIENRSDQMRAGLV